MPSYTLKYTSTNENVKANGNTEVTDIFNRYKDDGKITDSEVTESEGVYTQVISFDSVTSYNEWYAEIDSIDTSAPTGVNYIGSGVYAD